MKDSTQKNFLQRCQTSVVAFLAACAFLMCYQGVQAHGVQIGYCVLNNGFLRVYVEHWHGNISSSQLQPNGGYVVAPMSLTTQTTSGTVTQVRNAEGAAPGTTRFNLPGCGSNITLLAGCNSANRENNWFYWDFPPAACNSPVTVTFNAGLNAYTTEECTSLYPRTIQTSFSDQGGPALNCPDMNFNSCDPVTVTSYNFTAEDDCDPNPVVTVNPTAPHTFGAGSTPVTVVATDNLNQTTSCVFFVNVNQPGGCNAAPSAVCQNVNVSADANCSGSAGAAAFNGGSTDPDGDPLTYSVSPSGPYSLGSTNVTLTVSDGVLSDACTATITVTDNTPPSISCPSDMTLSCVRDVPAANAGAATVTDNCSVGSTSVSDSDNGGSGCAGDALVISRTYTARDGSGNTSSCTQTITVMSTPVTATISPNANVFPLVPDSSCADIRANGGGGCGPYTYAWDNSATGSSQTVCPTVTTTYTVTITDAEGCSTTASVTICPIDLTCVGGNNNGHGGQGQGGNGSTNGNGQVHIYICHIPAGNPGNAMTKCLPIGAVSGHLAAGHGGDHLGACGSIAGRTCSNKAGSSNGNFVTGSVSLTAAPNPFTNSSSIEVQFPTNDFATLEAYTIDGKRIEVLFSGSVEANDIVTVDFGPENRQPGVYLIRLTTASGKHLTKKLIMMR